jgi:hypothetical protein
LLQVLQAAGFVGLWCGELAEGAPAALAALHGLLQRHQEHLRDLEQQEQQQGQQQQQQQVGDLMQRTTAGAAGLEVLLLSTAGVPQAVAAAFVAATPVAPLGLHQDVPQQLVVLLELLPHLMVTPLGQLLLGAEQGTLQAAVEGFVAALPHLVQDAVASEAA